MNKSNSPPYVDILIPSKDRAMQLHLLLESMGKHLAGMGRITITWQGSDESHIAGYQLLHRRVREDPSFAALRKNSKEIVFRQRNSLREVYDAAIESGDSEYILPLVDDDFFIDDYDLVDANASKYFFSHSDVLACSLRLGDNLPAQVSHSLGDGILSEKSRGHGNSLLMTGIPRFLSPVFGHLISKEISDAYYAQDYLVWSWLENLNVPHWSCFFSTTSHIYRKKTYLDVFEKYGRENFLEIESKAIAYFINKAFPRLKILKVIFGGLFKIWSKYLYWKHQIWEEDFLTDLYCKYAFRVGVLKKTVPDQMVSGRRAVVVNIDLRNSRNRQTGEAVVMLFSSLYTKGQVLAYDNFADIKYLTPLSIMEDYPFAPYRIE